MLESSWMTGMTVSLLQIVQIVTVGVTIGGVLLFNKNAISQLHIGEGLWGPTQPFPIWFGLVHPITLSTCAASRVWYPSNFQVFHGETFFVGCGCRAKTTPHHGATFMSVQLECRSYPWAPGGLQHEMSFKLKESNVSNLESIFAKYLDLFKVITMVNYQKKPPVGRIYFSLFPSILSQM